MYRYSALDAKSIPKFFLSIIIIVSLLLVCGTILVVAFKAELAVWYKETRTRSAESAAKEKAREAMFLKFSQKEQEELAAKKGTVSVTDKPLYANLPYIWLGKPLSRPLPKNCFPAYGEQLTQLMLRWKNWGYDGLETCIVKNHSYKWNKFLASVDLYKEKELVRRIRWILEYEDLPTLKKEYNALGYDLAGQYGLPVQEVFEIDRGYEDTLEAYKNERVKAFRKFQAKDAEIMVSIKDSSTIHVDYYLTELRVGHLFEE